MADKKAKRPQITTPAGTFKYPKLTKPDYGTEDYPKPNGEYNLRLIVSKGDPAVQALLNKITPYLADAKVAAEDAVSKMKVEARKKLEAKGGIQENAVFTEIYDSETEEPTGEIELKFKMAASGIRKKDDSKWVQKPGIFDAKGKPVAAGVNIWGGTKGKVSFEPDIYFVAGSGAYGVTLRLKAVQIIDLVSEGARSASSYGFGEEEGFDASDLPAPEDDETSTDDTSSDTAGDEAADDGNF